MAKKIAIAIDGPSASGKTSAARLLAKKLGYRYLDTGLLYRAVAWIVLREKLDPSDEREVGRLLGKNRISVEQKGDRFAIRVNATDVTDWLKTPDLSRISSLISRYREVRRNLVELQKEVGKQEGVILVGRDIGTEILPDAPVKFYMDASIEVRGKRRFDELAARGFKGTLEETLREMTERDRQDRERAIAPMKRASDAIYLDTSGASLDGVVNQMAEWVAKRSS